MRLKQSLTHSVLLQMYVIFDNVVVGTAYMGPLQK